MILAVVMAVGAALVGGVLPAALRRLPPRVAGPEVMVTSWLTSMVVFGFFAVSAVVVAAWSGHAPAEGVAELAMRCVSQVQHTLGGPVRALLVVLAVLVATWLRARALVLARRQRDARSVNADRHHDALDGIARREQAAVTTLWLDHPVPLAYTVAGRPGFIVATDGLRTHLTPGEVVAVLAHERAHVRHHHHTIVAACDVLSRVLPVVPLFRLAPTVVRTQVELSADWAAVRATDRATVRAALRKVADFGSPAPAGALLLANEALALRIERLETAERCPRRRHRATVRCAGAAVLALVTPAVVALSLVGAGSAAACALV